MASKAELELQMAGMQATISSLVESLADVEASFAREDRGWQMVGGRPEEFTAEFRKERSAQASVAAAVDPLLKRAMNLRVAYLWAGGVQVSVRDDASVGQDVGAVVAGFWADKDVAETFSSTEALMGFERQLGTHGELFLSLPTNHVTGRVRVRSLPPSEVVRVHFDPEDAARPWFYERSFAQEGSAPQVVYYPAVSYRPASRPKRWSPTIGGTPHEVRWDAPVLHVAVNPVGTRGCGDLWAALPWARAYLGFLSDWAALMKALSRIAMQVRTRRDKVQQAAARVAAATQAGSGIALDADDHLEAVSTSGARFDADSGRPLATMVAAAVDLPVTTLLGDPGATGARAVAENVSEESWAVFEVRRSVWVSTLSKIIDHVIDSAVIAPAGPLRGSIVRDGDRQYAQLPDEDSRTVVVAFPEHDNADMLQTVQAIVQAAQTETLPPLTVLRLLLTALEVPDMDEVLEMVTDEDTGQFVPLDILDQRVRDRLADRGEAA